MIIHMVKKSFNTNNYISIKNAGKFLALTFALTWGGFLIPVILRLSYSHPITLTVYAVTGSAPSLIGIILVLRQYSKEQRRDFWNRVYNFKRIGLYKLLLILFFIPCLYILTVTVSIPVFGETPAFTVLKGYLNNPVGLIGFMLFSIIFGPLAEELGWRGYLYDCFDNMSFAVSGLLIGFFWTIWHLPMFFVSGSYQNGLLLAGALPVMDFALSTIALGVIINFFVMKTNRSILTAVILHFSVNFFGEITSLPANFGYVNTLFLILTALIVSIFFKKFKKYDK